MERRYWLMAASVVRWRSEEMGGSKGVGGDVGNMEDTLGRAEGGQSGGEKEVASDEGGGWWRHATGAEKEREGRGKWRRTKGTR